MITNFFIPELNNHDAQELWFQQDGATCHTARATIDLLKDTFGDRLISRFGPVNWPPRSCDLTPLDYFLWGYVKSLVYADKPQTLDHLEDNIRRVIADIRPQILEKVIENWTSRLDYIRASRGSPMPEILFKRSPRQAPSIYHLSPLLVGLDRAPALKYHVPMLFLRCWRDMKGESTASSMIHPSAILAAASNLRSR
ncbi:transposable element Tc3 transposase [Trichonephila clavipes]|nr:transposable element Tc3 transposase [Trichonephila clavipes]